MRVFDASALLAVLGQEPGADIVTEQLEAQDGVVASVNYAEVLTKLLDRGLDEATAQVTWRSLGLTVHPVDERLAAAAAALRPTTKALGLSLADRCCLALAQQLGNVTVVTADRPWKALKGFRLTFIR
jgi:ribonuclease VapC